MSVIELVVTIFLNDSLDPLLRRDPGGGDRATGGTVNVASTPVTFLPRYRHSGRLELCRAKKGRERNSPLNTRTRAPTRHNSVYAELDISATYMQPRQGIVKAEATNAIRKSAPEGVASREAVPSATYPN